MSTRCLSARKPKYIVMLNICIVAGARPNFIKVAPLVRIIIKAKAEGRAVDYHWYIPVQKTTRR